MRLEAVAALLALFNACIVERQKKQGKINQPDPESELIAAWRKGKHRSRRQMHHRTRQRLRHQDWIMRVADRITRASSLSRSSVAISLCA